MTHLTERSYALLLQGTLPPEDARALARHLEGPCAICEELLASLPTADAVDGLVEASLAALAPAGGRGNDLEFARIERRLRERAPVERRTARRAPRGGEERDHHETRAVSGQGEAPGPGRGGQAAGRGVLGP